MDSDFQKIIENFFKLYPKDYADGWDIEDVPFDESSSNVKLALFHIYDSILNSEYGSTRMLRMFKKDILFFKNIHIIAPVFDENPSKAYYSAMKQVHSYLTSRHTLSNCFVEFGGIQHSTKLILTRFPTFFRCLHVNTGEGLAGAFINVDGTQYYSVGAQQALVGYDKVDAFCEALKPYMFACHVMGTHEYIKLSKNEKIYVYEMCMNNYKVLNWTSPISNTFIQAYPGLSTNLFYEQFFKVLTTVTENGYMPNLRVTKESNAAFLDVWETSYQTSHASKDTNLYFKKALNNIQFKVNANVVYMKPQEGGTCTFMSIIAACLAVCTLPGYFTADDFFTFYNNVTEYGYQVLTTRDFSTEVKNFTSAPIFMQQLINDGILPASNTFTESVDAAKQITIRNKSASNFVIFGGVPLTELNDFANDIRNKTKSWANVFEEMQRHVRHFTDRNIKAGYDAYALFCLYLCYNYQNDETVKRLFTEDNERKNVSFGFPFPITEDENLWIGKLQKHLSDRDVETAMASLYINTSYFSKELWNKFIDGLKYLEREIKMHLYPFLHKYVLGATKELQGYGYGSMPIHFYYTDTYLVYYFQQLTANSEHLQTMIGVITHARVFLLCAGIFEEKIKFDIVAVLLHSFCNVWKPNGHYSDETFPGFVLINMVHDKVLVTSRWCEEFYQQHYVRSTSERVQVRCDLFLDQVVIVTILRQCVQSTGKFDINLLLKSDFTEQSAIEHPQFRYNNELRIYEYNVRENIWFTCVPINIDRTNPPYLLNYFLALDVEGSISKLFFTSKRGEQTLLLCVLLKHAYKDKDSLADMCIEIEYDPETMFENNKNSIRVDGTKITECILPNGKTTVDILKTAPFVCSLPRSCLKLIALDNTTNNVRVYLFHHNNDNPGCLAGAGFQADAYKNTHFRVELQIKENFLMPSLSMKQHKTLAKMKENSMFCMVNNLHGPVSKPSDVLPLLLKTHCSQLPAVNATPLITLFEAINSTGKQEAESCMDAEIIAYQAQETIEHLIAKHKEYRKKACANITFGQNNFFEFLHANATHLFKLLQSNTRITAFMRMKVLFEQWSGLNCYEILELKELLQVYEECKVNAIDAAFQIVFGNLVRKQQWDKYYEIVASFESGTASVFQFMMGKGKSSLITPMLLHYLTYVSPQSPLHIVMPPHLKSEVMSTIWEYDHLLTIPVTVLSDAELKHDFVRMRNDGAAGQCTASFTAKSVFLYDEIDDMYDATKSTFNLIKKDTKLNESVVQRSFQLAAAYVTGKPFVLNDDFEKQFHGILTNNAFKRNINYGMSSIKQPPFRFCVPYEKRLDSPMEGSRFSSVMHTLAFTALYFYNTSRQSFVLYKEDVEKICNQGDSMPLISRLIREWGANTDGRMAPINALLATFNEDEERPVSETTMALYYNMIIFDVPVSEETYNCSFVDVMNLKEEFCQWAVGYSGTVLMNLNVTTNQRFETVIKADPDEEAGVKAALDAARIKIIGTRKDVWEQVRDTGVTAVIDACALFEGLGNDVVAKKLYKASGQKEVVYVRRDDKKMCYGPLGPYPYVHRFREPGSVVYFYSQRHIVGVDFKQPAVLKGLLLLGPDNTRTQAAQAMYRLRKLNRGHSIVVGACFGVDFSNGVLKTLRAHEESEQRSKDVYLQLQTIKYLERKSISAADNAYLEKVHTGFQAPPDYNFATVDNEMKALFKGRIVSAESKNILQKLKSRSLEELINVLYNRSSCAETAVVQDTTANATANASTNAEANAIVNASTQVAMFDVLRKPNEPYNTFIKVWDWTTNEIHVDGIVTIQAGASVIVLSKNLAYKNNSSHIRNRSYFIVHVHEQVYLIEPLDVLPLYLCCGKPLINMAGNVINNYKPFLFEPVPASVIPRSLLNVICVWNTFTFPLWQLFSLSPESKWNVTTSTLENVSPTTIEIELKTACNLGYLFRTFAKLEDMVVNRSNLPTLEGAYAILRNCERRDTYRDITKIPFTASCQFMRNVYAPATPSPCKDLRMEAVTDYVAIVEENNIQRNNFIYALNKLTAALTINVVADAERNETYENIDIDRAITALKHEVMLYVDLLYKTP